VDISRTGYTGDLGYEIWMPAERALDVWDALTIAGQAFESKPAGMLALDVARTEPGLLLLDVDYVGSRKALIPSQRYSP
jgi:aminomethyltransferase